MPFHPGLTVNPETAFQHLDKIPHQMRTMLRRAVQPLPAGQPDQIVVVGVGTSAAAGACLQAFTSDRLPCPLIVLGDSHLPAFVSAGTLVILISYSGNPPDMIRLYHEAAARGASMLVVSGGGDLARMARRRSDPAIRLPAGLLGGTSLYPTVILLLLTLAASGLIPDPRAEIMEAIRVMRALRREVEPKKQLPFNQARILAEQFFMALPVIWGSGDATGAAAQRWKRQLNRISQVSAISGQLPELALADWLGLRQPKAVVNRASVILLTDGMEDEFRRDLFERASELARDRVKVILTLKPAGESRMARTLWLIYLGDWVSAYLAELYGLHPQEAIESELCAAVAAAKRD
ncbi:MAG: SIS domain-containing protein [Solirubrobacterales bacterium]